jgi:hypothetical protein
MKEDYQNETQQPHTAKDIYQIRVRTHLDQRWTDWFEDFRIEYQDEYSIITGPVLDQPALHGLLAKIRDLGLEILLVEKLGNFDKK